jgi:hypothetical protein
MACSITVQTHRGPIQFVAVIAMAFDEFAGLLARDPVLLGKMLYFVGFAPGNPAAIAFVKLRLVVGLLISPANIALKRREESCVP